MSTQKSTRKRFSSLLATATAALVVASGMALAPTAAFAEEPVASAVTGTATVSSATETGINVDVAVAGIADAVTTYPNGVHIGIVTRGSADGAVQDDFVGGTASIGRAGTMPADGTAAAKIPVPAAQLDRTKQYEAVVWPQRTNPTDVNIVKVVDFDVTEAQWDAVFPVVEPEAPATALVAAVSAASTTGLSVKADLANIVSPTGAYVSLIEAGTSDDLTAENMGIATDWVKSSQFVDGAGTVTLQAPVAKLDRTKSYELISWKAHSLPTADTVFNVAPLTVTAAQWDSVFPVVEPEVPATTLTAKVTKATKDGLEVTANFTNVVSPSGAYVSLIEADTSGDLTAENMGVATDWVKSSQFLDGAGTVTLKAPTAKLDRKKSYEVISWKAHSLPTADTIFNVSSLEVSAAQWDAAFKKDETKPQPTPEVKIPFTDVKKGDKFFKEISWMYTSKLSTGVKQQNGSVQYQPKANVTREAMAAFLYRLNVDKDYKEPKASKFSDVKPGDKFYKEITWMGEMGYSTGVKQADGTRAYAPKSSITREAMAAFMYRIDDSKKDKTPTTSAFIDVNVGDKFYKEIAWMSQSGLSTGINQANGKKAYAPKTNVTREAMAAFLFRADK